MLPLASKDMFILNNSELLFFKDMIMREFNNFKNSIMDNENCKSFGLWIKL